MANAPANRRTIVVLQVQRLAALGEIEETCRRAREYWGDCRIMVVAGPATRPFVQQLGCAEEVLPMQRWNRRRMLALVRRLRRRGATDACIVYDSAASPGPARLELLALAMGTPVHYRELGGPVKPLSRARLWVRFCADAALAALSAGAGAAVAVLVGAALLMSRPFLASPRRQADLRRRRIRLWNNYWLRKL